MFDSHHRCAQEPGKAGVSFEYREPDTDAHTDTIDTPVPWSPYVIDLFTRAPYDDQAAREWKTSKAAREAAMELRGWLRANTKTVLDSLRFDPLENELWWRGCW